LLLKVTPPAPQIPAENCCLNEKVFSVFLNATFSTCPVFPFTEITYAVSPLPVPIGP
jgi:hypothetical protein